MTRDREASLAPHEKQGKGKAEVSKAAKGENAAASRLFYAKRKRTDDAVKRRTREKGKTASA